MILLKVDGHAPATIEHGQTLLEAGLAAGLPLPYGCRSGLCGACRMRLVAGEVTHDPHAAAALSPAERRGGIVLACRARATSDVTLALADAPLPPPFPRRFDTRVANRRPLGPRITELAVEPPPGGLAYLAGQYATLGFAGAAPRDFSMAGLPGDATITFHLRAAGSGGAAAAAADLRPGDPVTMEGPFGRAYLRPDGAGPLLLVAGGTGLAPMLAIARAALAEQPDRPTTLCAGATDPADLYGAACLDGLAAAHPSFAWQAATDRLVAVAVTTAESLDAPVIHAAGPPAMVRALRSGLRVSGVRPAAFHSDAFNPVG
ncbi:CDP-4-dehydro-6-deoxyglucose reductase/ferredoxin-NAD(P)+ reductase (naphthalene dioxygenase ferredoxin-specific) [Stella humosa]|uniref:CDP-4-dehydro-6-deoxyglucose reductase/ferredoxin-NAD(P)+ reductase (Naphthalene dioxygenase ferredoxin-specific) n=1 Tax=Stella humosa TaxID=94 RepID=A0A3N1LI72_9PROT|nr:2Fe-2S iron-sulfur cluster-binding protein [Stella humosa]ROP90914.1 CDP-4-dehydro-6-deoxyglucose reductase/ferredoxin-NAD(P)+ reductase (naphthalene dioxygenase ferredoxin-specific) [Stella humosa]BBK34736.1 oxidoreductase [Stella humosa]